MRKYLVGEIFEIEAIDEEDAIRIYKKMYADEYSNPNYINTKEETGIDITPVSPEIFDDMNSL